MKDFFRFLVSKAFLKQVLLILVFIFLVLLLVFFWLRSYTNHGQKIALPSYIDMPLKEAQKAAKAKTFEIVVTDSVHIVGVKGGVILDQNPKQSAEVKENRKIYVRISKYQADMYSLKDLPSLYGNDYDQKSADLKRFELNTKIVDRQYDPGEPGHILEVRYNGKKIVTKDIVLDEFQIPKGGTLEFVVSDRAGGYITVPDLLCQEFSAAEFYLKAGSKLTIGKVIEQGDITNRNTAYVVSQYPSPGSGEVAMGSPIDITITQDRPVFCTE